MKKTMKTMAKNDAVCCALCSCLFINLSISNFSLLTCSFQIFNKFSSLFSFHLFIQLNEDVVVLMAGWCVSRISFYMSVLVKCM
jgi:hypothetical protein